MDDANLNRAARSTAEACFANAGQVCTSGERIIVHDNIHDQFVSAMVREAGNVKLGSPFEAETTYGPLIDEQLASKVDRHVTDAVGKGGKVRSGGKRAAGFPTNLYYEATVIDGVQTSMMINREETFGPVVPIIRARSLHEALEIADTSEYGLSASIFTENMNTAFQFAERMPAGTVEINAPPTYWHPFYPTGGMRKSGIGREGGKYSLLEMSQLKTVIIDISSESISDQAR